MKATMLSRLLLITGFFLVLDRDESVIRNSRRQEWHMQLEAPIRGFRMGCDTPSTKPGHYQTVL